MHDLRPEVRHDVRASSHLSPGDLMIRMLIRIGIALLGAAIGFIVAALVLDDMNLDGAAFLLAVVIFVVLTAVLEPLIEKIGDEHLSIVSMFSSLITTFLALLITDLISDGLSISGSVTWVLATLIVWASTALATLILARMFIKNVRENR
jgi:hypothetical protein